MTHRHAYEDVRLANYTALLAEAPSGELVRLHVAESLRARLIGLAGLAVLPADRGLLIPRCASVHTFGMRFAIDVAFVRWPPCEGRLRVLDVREGVAPAHVVARRLGSRLHRRQVATLELSAGSADRLGLAAGRDLLAD